MQKGETLVERVSIPERAPYYSQAVAAVKLAQEDMKESFVALCEVAIKSCPAGPEERLVRRIIDQAMGMEGE